MQRYFLLCFSTLACSISAMEQRLITKDQFSKYTYDQLWQDKLYNDPIFVKAIENNTATLIIRTDRFMKARQCPNIESALFPNIYTSVINLWCEEWRLALPADQRMTLDKNLNHFCNPEKKNSETIFEMDL